MVTSEVVEILAIRVLRKGRKRKGVFRKVLEPEYVIGKWKRLPRIPNPSLGASKLELGWDELIWIGMSCTELSEAELGWLELDLVELGWVVSTSDELASTQLNLIQLNPQNSLPPEWRSQVRLPEVILKVTPSSNTQK